MNLGKSIFTHLLFVLLLMFTSVQNSYAYSAYPLNPELAGLCTGGDCTGNFPKVNMPVYKSMLKAYSIALSAPLLSPANTIGINGFEFDFAYSFTTPADTDWQYATERRTAERWEKETSGDQSFTEKSIDSSLNTLFFTLRKGLPYSIEVEAQLGYLVKTEISSLGGSFKWSLNEAVKKFPIDVMTRFNILHTVNPKHLDFSTVGLDFAVGKPFGIFGLLNLAPYVAYRPLWIIPHSTTVDSVPNRNTNDPNNMTMTEATGPLVFPSKEEEGNFPIMVNRFTLGARFLTGVFKFTPEFTMAPDETGTHTSISLSIGLNL